MDMLCEWSNRERFALWAARLMGSWRSERLQLFRDAKDFQRLLDRWG